MRKRRLWVGLILAMIMLATAFSALSQTAVHLADLTLQEKPDEYCAMELLPSSTAARGESVLVSVVLANNGDADANQFDVLFSWRRIDQQQACGFKVESVTSLEAGKSVPLTAKIDTNTLVPGTYDVVVKADSSGTVPESDETNNRCSTSLQIRVPRAELHTISLEITPPSPVELGETFRVLSELRNTGDAAAGQFAVRFWFSPVLYSYSAKDNASGNTQEQSPQQCQTWAARRISEIGENEWILYASVVIPGLERDEGLSLEQVFDTAGKLKGLLKMHLNEHGPSDIGGSCYPITIAIKVTIEDLAGWPEEDPYNNQTIALLTIGPSEYAKPDLHPVRLTFNRDLPLEWKNEVKVTALVANTGGKATEEDIEVAFYLRDMRGQSDRWGDPIGRDHLRGGLAIEEGSNTGFAEYVIKYPKHYQQPGSYELRVLVDSDSSSPVDESNETNNEMVVGFSIEGAELHPRSLEVRGTRVVQGDTIAVTSEIENTGRYTAENFTVAFFIDDVRFDTYYYQGSGDGRGMGENAVVKARGVLDTTDLFSFDSTLIQTASYTLRVVVDPDDRIPETDEANNVISTPLVVHPPEPRYAELHPIEVTLDPPSPVPVGQGVLVRATVRNSGNIDADRFQVKVALGYGECKKNAVVQCSECQKAELEGETDMGYRCCQCVDVEDLPRGAKTVIERWFSTAGLEEGRTYWVSVSVDPPNSEDGSFGEIDEMDENNNELIVYFTVGTPTDGGPSDKPNLTVRSLTVNPPSPVDENTPIRVTAEVANTGGEAAGSFDIRFRIHGAYLPSPNDITRTCAGLKPRASKTETISIQLRRGTYELEVAVDPKNRIVESVETDNQITRTLSVGVGPQRADLIPITVHFDPSSPKVGDNVRV
ncbi:hypothetical protein KAX17_11480, partial [Candidatus Bipolaricaulota bacterium]|nr:hypothetical protein [Candidatus Bipolaricaulota bacterium]